MGVIASEKDSGFTLPLPWFWGGHVSVDEHWISITKTVLIHVTLGSLEQKVVLDTFCRRSLQPPDTKGAPDWPCWVLLFYQSSFVCGSRHVLYQKGCSVYPVTPIV